MPKKLRILLRVTMGLTISALLVITLRPLVPAMLFLGPIFICGVLVICWTPKTVRLGALKNYLILAGASAMGIPFFSTPTHVLDKYAVILFVCPVALFAGALLALGHTYGKPQANE